MAHPNEDVARKASEALAAGDMEGFFRMHADDVTAHVPIGDFHGPDGLRQSFEQLGAGLDGPPQLVDVHDVLGSDEHAVVLATQRFTKGGKTFDSRNTVVM